MPKHVPNRSRNSKYIHSSKRDYTFINFRQFTHLKHFSAQVFFFLKPTPAGLLACSLDHHEPKRPQPRGSTSQFGPWTIWPTPSRFGPPDLFWLCYLFLFPVISIIIRRGFERFLVGLQKISRPSWCVASLGHPTLMLR